MSEELENLFRQTSSPPSARLRGRVLAAVVVELRDSPTVLPWRRVAALAAMVILWVHVSWSASLHVRLDPPATSAVELARTAEQIRGLLPELSEAESRRMALRATIGASRPLWGITSDALKR